MNKERNPVGWFELYVSDMERARNFYQAVFGFEFEKLPLPENAEDGFEMLMFPGDPALAGSCGALCRMEGVTPGGVGGLVYFSCRDCGEEQSRVDAAGGTVVKAKFSISPYGDIALVTDSEGNMIGLHNPPEGAEGC